MKLSGGWALPPGQVSLWRAGQLTDTVVTVEGRGFATSKLVLAGGSDYFRSHFLNEQMARGAANPTLQEHVSAAAFEPLLAFLYEGECTFDETRLTEVLQAASYLTVAPLEQAAVAALTERLSPSNALAAWSLADQLSLPELAEAAKETALKDFDEVEKIEEATLAQVQSLVADDRLTAKSEEAVFSAVARFAEAKQPAEAELLGLLRNVRFSLMSGAFLLEKVHDWPMIQTVAGQRLLFQMMAPFVGGPAQQPRFGCGGRFVYVMGGATGPHDTDSVDTIEIYDAQADSWAAGSPMPRARFDAAAEILGGKIYVLGGEWDGPGDEFCERSNTVMVYEAGAWAEGIPMRAERSALAAAVVGGKIYAMGGCSDAGSVEAFDPHTGMWAELAPMPTSRILFAAAVLDGKIYVAGGDADGASTKVDVYDPQTNTWAGAPPMSWARMCFGMAAHGGKIYVAGGVGGEPGLSKAVEAFDPKTNSWAAVAPMSTSRSQFSLIAARGKLYAVGGVDESHDPMSTVEAYDPQQDRWADVAPMATARCDYAVAAL